MVKNPPASAGDVGSIPGSGRSSGKGNGNPLKFSCLRNSMDRGAWRATGHGIAKRQTMTERLTLYSPIAMLPLPASLFPLVTKFVFPVCESALKLSFVPCSWLLQPFQKHARGFLNFPITSFCWILPFIVVFHFVLLLPPHHCLTANCFPLIIILTSAYCKNYKTQAWALPPPKTKIPHPSYDVCFCFLPQWQQVGGHFQRLPERLGQGNF